MATKTKGKAAEQPLPDVPKGDWRDLADRVAENPLLFVGAIAFILVAAIAGWLIRVYQGAVNQEYATAYARAFEEEEKTAIVAALEPLAEQKSEALYMMAETAYKAGDLEAAKAAYTRMRQEFPDSPFAADAVEGLGFIEESNGNYEEAKQIYLDIISSFPDSFAAKRQQFNIGRCEEAAGNKEAAIEAYRAQSLAFPNSQVAARAGSKMAMLQAELGTGETTEDTGIESALNAVLESATAEEDAEAATDPVDAEITEMPAEEFDTERLELSLPEPGAGAGAVETEEAEDVTP